jgi:Peptidase family M28
MVSNPLSFKPWPVTIITSIVYVGLIATILVIHLTVPPAPSTPTPLRGINLTEAWADLQELSNGFHPYNSKRNDGVRDWLLQRVDSILRGNNATFSSEDALDLDQMETGSSAVIFNDNVSNLTFSSAGIVVPGTPPAPGISVYFEGTNIMVYVRGTSDKSGSWWNYNEGKGPNDVETTSSKSGVLVNAHYDSVSTGFGATDDGVGVVTILQLIKFYTTPGNTPRKGLVALFNNGEEDFLNGARAFTQHPISQFAHTFLNLEGAGAGGRATLFRSTDAEVTKFYRRSKHPFGTVISGDGFKRGFIRSQTDYVVFNGDLGSRGLDVAFWEPRSRYHTDQDDTRHTSKDSLWHMLSAAISTTQGLTADSSSTFDSFSSDVGAKGNKIAAGHGSDGVWFDVFGLVLAVFNLHTLFAWCLTLLIVPPLTLIGVSLLLKNFEKFYLFSGSITHVHGNALPDAEQINVNGWRGFTRYPVAFVLASGLVALLAFLLKTLNPYIVYSSEYAVWSMMLSAWFFVAWFVLSMADFVRPSALQRGYAWLWTFLGAWIVLVAITVFTDRMKIAGGYFLMFFSAATFLATLISFLEYFGLPRKSAYAQSRIGGESESRPDSIRGSSRSIKSARNTSSSIHEPALGGVGQDGEEAEASETTPLVGGTSRKTTFANYSRSSTRPGTRAGSESVEGQTDGGSDPYDAEGHEVIGNEQDWSAKLPQWTWIIQLLLVAPTVIILAGPVGLLLASAMNQTGADGNDVLGVYLIIGFFSVLLLVPIGPFIHRFTYHVPTFLLFIFIGTFIYNALAFPFSAQNRLKVYFVQTVDLESGTNLVRLSGVGNYVQRIVSAIPSSAGTSVSCTLERLKPGLTTCSWSGLAPKVVPTPPGSVPPGVPPGFGYADWISLNVTRSPGTNKARFTISGRNTRACKLLFKNTVSDIYVHGSAPSTYYTPTSDGGSKELRLWSREWEKPWIVDVKWKAPEDEGEVATETKPKDEIIGLDGSVVCLWSDANESGVIPALDEIRRFAPDWAVPSKFADGLVEGSKPFMI